MSVQSRAGRPREARCEQEALPQPCERRRDALTTEKERKQNDTRTPDVDRFSSIRLCLREFGRGCGRSLVSETNMRSRKDRTYRKADCRNGLSTVAPVPCT